MDEFFKIVLEFASNHTHFATALLILGGLVFFATLLKGFVLALVAITPNKKDDILAGKFYTFLDSTSIYFQPLVDFFKKKFGL